MKKINTAALFPLSALIVLVFTLSNQMFGVPPLGKLLDPFIGAVQNEDSRDIEKSFSLFDKQELEAPVEVYFDKRKVPHIFAQNTNDLYYAQGYVTAFFRLWQMDFTTYAAAGRLSEIFGKKENLEYDRTQRRIGMLSSAKEALKLIEANPVTNAALTAYTRGVNAYISKLNYRTIPLEYKLMAYTPEPWTNLKSVLILKSMANNMSGYEEDLFMSKMILALGNEKFNRYFPDFPSSITPVMSENKPLAGATPAVYKLPAYLDYSFLSANSVIAPSEYDPRMGSNSWAVSGKNTKSGFPILANDPHLRLSLPNIWIEMQLATPDMNVYGVAIPGSPAIVIGFNENVAWGITNGADDVKDWYKLKITSDYKKYAFGNKWLDMGYQVEEIKRRGQPAFYDTVYHTQHGPIVYNKSFPGKTPDMSDMALKWELHRPSNEFLTFILLNKAHNFSDYKEAIRHYQCPLQNFTYAGRDSNIAIVHQGSMPVKWAGQGRFVLDGTNSEHLYTTYIPEDSLPHDINPASGYVLSANQHPTWSNYSYYYNGYYSETRANRINELLQNRTGLDIADMEAIQLDNTSPFVKVALPVLLNAINRNKLSPAQLEALQTLSSWKGNYDYADKEGRLWDLWWRTAKEFTWDEFEDYLFYLRAPDDEVQLGLIRDDPNNEYFDKQGTAVKENASDIITTAFISAFDDYSKTTKAGKKIWSDYHKVNIMHLANLTAFSKMNLSAAGQSEVLNATSRNWGPSWRMIVELGDRPRAFGIYPGGQSGNPASPYYESFIDDWGKGKYYELNYFISAPEAKAKASVTWKFNAGK